MKRLLITLSVLACAGSTAHAQDIDLSIGSSVRAMHSSSVDAITADDTHGFFSIAAGVELNRLRVPWVDIIVDASFDIGGFAGESFQRMETDTSLKSGMVGARARWNVSPRGNFFGRAAIGLTHIGLELRDAGSAGPHLADDRFSASSYLGGGLELYPVRAATNGRERFAMGLRLEGGYFASTPVSMRAVARGENVEDGAIRIPTRRADLGSLNLSAWIARVGLVARF